MTHTLSIRRLFVGLLVVGATLPAVPSTAAAADVYEGFSRVGKVGWHLLGQTRQGTSVNPSRAHSSCTAS